jgi:hypothetical protein
MGLLDDAIREHLDLKRRRGADPAEVERAEREALGPVRRGREAPSADPEPAAASPAGAFDHEQEAHWAEPETEHPAAAYPAPPPAQPYFDPPESSSPPPPGSPPPLELVDDHAGSRVRRLPHPEPDEEFTEFDDDEPLFDHDAEQAPRRGRRLRFLGRRGQRGEEHEAELESEAEHDLGGHDPREHDLGGHDLGEVPLGDETAEHPRVPPGSRPARSDETAEYDVEEALAYEHAAAPEDEDVLDQTPEFLQDVPDHDRLWFEQRPPRDFDFDG